jgi:predicted Zn finger-like uncharacterized protein
MIITCINCNKKFNVNSELIPDTGRTIQCGSCNHIWFFKKNDQKQEKLDKPIISQNKNVLTRGKKIKDKSKLLSKKIENLGDQKLDTTHDKKSELIKYQPRSIFTYSKFLSYILVSIITFLSFLLILDTFQTILYNFFPNLEFLIFNLYETIKDIKLFIYDLI